MKPISKLSLAMACCCALACCWLLFAFTARADPPKLTLYLPFENSLEPKIAAGDPLAVYGAKTPPAFAPGITGQGWITGESNQSLTFQAAGNLSPDQWTITFWVKGLPGAVWNNVDDPYLQIFWALNGEQSALMWFYKYPGYDSPFLLSWPKTGQEGSRRMTVPKAPEEEWHFWATTWRKGTGAYQYLDGQLIGQSATEPPDPTTTLLIGQPVNPAVQNKIIDEFKIYDATLDSGAIARLYRQEGDFALLPSLTAAPTTQKIVIDGKINDAEWKNAAGFSGLIDRESWDLAAPETRGKIAYDDQNLYIALHSDNPPEVRNNPALTVLNGFVKKDATAPGPAVEADDNFFVRIVPGNASGREYSLRVNGLGTTYATLQEKGAAETAAWDAAAQVKSDIGMDGWSLEAAIPLKSLGVEKIADGTTWHMDFGRVWKRLRQKTEVWAAGERVKNESPTNRSGLGTVRFAGNASAVTDLQKFDIAPDGRVTAQVQISNPTAAQHEVTLSLRAADQELQQQKIALAPHENKAIKLAALPQNADGALAEVVAQSGDTVLARQSAPLILERVGQLALWSYPSTNQLRVGWVVQSVSDPKTLSLQADLKDAGGKVLQTVKVAPLPSLSGSQLLDVKNLAPAKYTLAVQIKNGASVVQQQTLSYEKKPLPEWWGNTLGISDTPPPPWTDLKVDKAKDTVSVWGRDLEYSGALLPSQIVNQGKTMLSSPMRLIAQSATAAPVSSTSGKADAKWKKVNAVRADFSRTQTLGNVRVQTDSFIEFDGMTWLDMRIAPTQKTAALSNLTLEIPLKAEWAKLLKPGDDYSLKQTGLLPANGWEGRAMSMPWLGNGDGGLQFFLETDATWIGSKSIAIVPDGRGAVVLRVHLVDAPATLDKPLQLSFGWMASPVRPAPRDGRDWRMLNEGRMVNAPADHPAVTYAIQANRLIPNFKPNLTWWQWWWLPEGYKENPDLTGTLPIPSGSKFQNAVIQYHGVTFYGAPYGRLAEMGTANPWFAQFGDEWVPDTSKVTPDASLPPLRQKAIVSQAAPSLRDFYAWGYNRLFNEGDVHALYFDVSSVISDTNIYHGAGTLLPDGTIAPTRNILGTREIFKRIYTLLKAKHPDDGRIFYHMSGEMMLPIFSFSDALVDGENFTGALDRKDNRGYENFLALDQFRTEYSTQNNIGPLSVFLPEFDRSGAVLEDEWKDLGYGHAEYLLGLILLHDSNIMWAYFPDDVLSKAYGALDKTGWNSTWTFVPYWKQTGLKLPDGVKASLYISPDKTKTVAILMNVSDTDQSVDLPLTGNAFKGQSLTSASAVYPDEAVTVEDKTIRHLQIKSKNFRAILLQ